MATRTARGMSSATILDISDRELLWAVHETEDGDGWATTYDIAQYLGMTGQRKHQCIGSRLARMVQYDWIRKHKDEPRTWRITRTGEAIRNGQMTDDMKAALGNLDLGQKLLVVRDVARSTARKKSTGMAVRREFRHNTGGIKYNGKG